MTDKIIILLKELFVKIKDNMVLILLAIGLLLIVFFIGRCNRQREHRQEIANLIAARDSIHKYSITIDGLKNSVHEQKAIILSQDDAIKAGLIREDVLKKQHIKDVVSNVNLQGQIRYKDSLLALPHKETIITVIDTSGRPYDFLKIPFTLLDIKDKYLTLLAGMDTNKKAYYTSIANFEGSVLVGFKRQGLFKPTIPVGTFTTENKHINMTNMQVTITKDPPKWYEKTWVHMIIGGGITGTAILLLKK